MSNTVNAMIITGAIEKLHAALDEFNKQTAKENRRMFQLTFVIAILTFVMLIAVGVQIYFAVDAIGSQSNQTSAFNKPPEAEALHR